MKEEISLALLMRRSQWICLLSLLCLSIACVNNAKAPASPTPLGAAAKSSKQTLAFYKQAGWIPLQEPDSRFVPGSIFEVKNNQYPRWISSLATCGVPDDVLKPKNNDTGSWSYKGTATYDAGVVLQIKGVSIGPNFTKATTAILDQSDSGASAIDIIALAIWTSKSPGAFSSVCTSYLSQPDTYVAQESYRVGSGKYTLNDSTGAKLNLSGLKTKILTLSANADATITADSSLQLTVPVYTALHAAVEANGLLKTLGNPASPTIPTADQQILSKLPQ